MDMLVAPNVDVVADSFDRGYDAGFNAGVGAPSVSQYEQAYKRLRYLVSCAYADLIADGVTEDSPIVHDVIEHVLKVVDGVLPARDYANWDEGGH